MNFLNLNMVKVNGKTRQDLLNALAELGTMDLDFCGENGDEYIWEGIERYESNMEFLLDMVNDNDTDKDVIEEYVKRWIGGDSYYKDHILDVIYDENGKAECIALAVLT